MERLLATWSWIGLCEKTNQCLMYTHLTNICVWLQGGRLHVKDPTHLPGQSNRATLQFRGVHKDSEFAVLSPGTEFTLQCQGLEEAAHELMELDIHIRVTKPAVESSDQEGEEASPETAATALVRHNPHLKSSPQSSPQPSPETAAMTLLHNPSCTPVDSVCFVYTCRRLIDLFLSSDCCADGRGGEAKARRDGEQEEETEMAAAAVSTNDELSIQNEELCIINKR